MNSLFRITLIFFALVIMTSCSRTPEQEIIHLLKRKYSNLYVNESYKRETIRGLREFLKENHLSDETYPEIQEYIHRINDGHVVLYRNDFMKQGHFESGLIFIPGSSYIKSCSRCLPSVTEGKYKILEINDIPLEKYLEMHAYSVSASTPRGRKFRILRKLVNNSQTPEVRMKLLSTDGTISSTVLDWQITETKPHQCVSGERLDEKIFKLNIHSLWCDDRTNFSESRRQVLYRFKQEFDSVLQEVRADDLIVLDLRENGGGGDQEVEYVLKTLSDKPMFMYKFQYLSTTTTSKFRKWLARISIQAPRIWDKEEYLFSNPRNDTIHKLFENKMITLISEGCFSSCEGLASSLKFENRSLLLGSKTHGGAGDPILFPIKNSSFSLNVPTCLSWQKDGSLFEGIGVDPNLKKIQKFIGTSDSVLEESVRILREI